MTENNTYVIPAVNFVRLEEEIGKLNRRAEKLGRDPIKLTVLNKLVSKKRHDLGFEYDDISYECVVEGESPKLEGWTLVAILEPQPNAEMLVREVPGQTCPVEYRTTDLRCDHCAAIRRRNNVYVLRHDTGTHRQVGRNCLVDFLGHESPESLLAGAEYLITFDKLVREASEEGWGGRTETVVPLEQFVAVCSAVIRKMGWVSKSQAFESYDDDRAPEPTASVAWRLCTMPNDKYVKQLIADKGIAVLDGDVKSANAAIDWAAGIQPEDATSAYMHDLGVTCRQHYVRWKTAGYVGSVLVAYNYHLRDELAKKSPKPDSTSEHIGSIKDRLVLEGVKITAMTPYMSGVYSKTRVEFSDANGNVLIWRASGSPEWLKVGESFTIKATVKAHDTYNGVKQTIIERVANESPVEAS